MNPDLMITDLWMLVATAVMCMSLPVVYLVGRTITPGGKEYGFGNRAGSLDNAPAWCGRAQRAHTNLIENIGAFAILVLVAFVTGKSNDTTALGSMIFFGARVGHAIVYIAGILYVRTLMFLTSIVGMVMIFSQLL